MAVEFLEVEPIVLTEEYLRLKWPTKMGKTHLLVILDANSEEEMDRVSQAVADVCLEKDALNIFIAETPSRQEEVLSIRSKIYEAIKAGTVEILDISVPRAEIAGHVRKVGEIARKYDIWLPTFGHAADGNIHTHIMKARYMNGEMVPVPVSQWRDKVDKVREEIFQDCRERGGVISGEHGIGLVKKPYLALVLDEKQIDLMRGIKKVFDPAGIMNPGKIFD
jgi:glycolate oxidase